MDRLLLYSKNMEDMPGYMLVWGKRKSAFVYHSRSKEGRNLLVIIRPFITLEPHIYQMSTMFYGPFIFLLSSLVFIDIIKMSSSTFII